MRTCRWICFVSALLLGLAVVSLAAAQQPGAPAANRFESEPNDDPASADSLHQLGDVMAATIEHPGDVDYFKVSTHYGQHLLFDIDLPDGSALAEPLLCLYTDPTGPAVACNTDGDLYTEPLLFYSSHGTILYLRVSDWASGGGGAHIYRLMAYTPLYVSATTGGVVAGIPFGSADVLAHYDFHDGTEKWLMFFDASDAGINRNLSALSLHLDGEVWFTLQSNQTLDVGGQPVRVTPYHLNIFILQQPGAETRGYYLLPYDYRQDGFTTAGERFDAVTINGSIYMPSTTGAADTPWGRFQDEDVLDLFDGTAVPGLAAEDVIAAEWDWHEDVMYLTILGSGVVGDRHYDQKDIFMVDRETHQPLGGYWRGPQHNFNYNIDAFELGWDERQ